MRKQDISQEVIIKASKEAVENSEHCDWIHYIAFTDGFRTGVEWLQEVLAKYDLEDEDLKEQFLGTLESVIELCNKAAVGNTPHNIATIKSKVQNEIAYINEFYKNNNEK